MIPQIQAQFITLYMVVHTLRCDFFNALLSIIKIVSFLYFHKSCRPASPTHQLDAVAHHAHHRARLQHLAAAAGDAVLNLGQAVEPGDHDLGRDVELGELLGEGGDDVGEGEALQALDGVYGGEAAGDVGGAEQRRHDLLDGVGRGRGDARVDGLGGDCLALNLAVGDLGGAGGS